jgi:hypothetical protein
MFWWFFPFFFVGTWVAVSLLISRIGGWSTLSDYYRCAGPFSGQMIRMQSASFRVFCGYNHCLNFGVNAEGLYLAPLWLFRAFHPPLLFRWNEISAQPYQMFGLFSGVRLRFEKVPFITASISTRLFDRLVAVSGGRLVLDTKKAPVI